MSTETSRWFLREDGAIVDENGLIVCDDVEYSDDARLIAAAPELLEALKAACNDVALAAEIARARGVLAVSDELSSHLRIYRIAIAKAEGK